MVEKISRLTAKDLRELLSNSDIPDDAIICCQSDEEGNRTMVCMDVWAEKVGERIAIRDGYGTTEFVAGDDVIGLDLEKDKDKVFITLRPMY